MDPLNILFVVPYIPNKIRVRPYNFIRYLAKLGHRITLLTVWTHAEELETLKQLEASCELVKAVNLPTWRSLLNCVSVLPTKRPLQSAYSWDASLADELFELASDNNGSRSIDIVHVEHLRGAQYGVNLKSRLGSQNSSLPVVWDSVDSISLLFRQAMIQSKSAISRGMTRFELGRTEFYEAWLLNQFDQVLVTSEMDKRKLLSLNGDKRRGEGLAVLPNGVDLEYFKPLQEIEKEHKTIVLSGKMSYHANVTMAMDFIEEIMPQVWAGDPEVKVCIVGKDPPARINSLNLHPNVQVTGTVADIRPYLCRATIAAAPITYGAGIQNKVLEAMACGTPVVASPHAISALKAEVGKDVIIAEDSSSFAESILGILEDEQMRSEIALAGRKFVESNHDWSVIATQLQDIYLSTREKIKAV